MIPFLRTWRRELGRCSFEDEAERIDELCDNRIVGQNLNLCAHNNYEEVKWQTRLSVPNGKVISSILFNFLGGMT